MQSDKNSSPHGVSNPRPSGLRRSALTATLPRASCSSPLGLIKHYANELVESGPIETASLALALDGGVRPTLRLGKRLPTGERAPDAD
jgi:hypothetical protein